MKKNASLNHHTALPIELHKRVEMVIAACIAYGHVNRHVLAEHFRLRPLQASVLLRDFLQEKSREIRRDSQLNGYVLSRYPGMHTSKHHPNSHSS